jgi:protocatechuate 3,4-dioxygenase alpha subunit
MTRLRTPSQTVGPYFSIAIPQPGEDHVVPEETPGAFWIRGRMTDGAGDPVPDGLVETWQADPAGRFPGDGAAGPFRGFGRGATDDHGRYAVLTVKPGAVPTADGRPQAPHINVLVFARGLLKPLVTRIYFPDEAEANERDPGLSSIDPLARATLIAAPTADGFRFDIRLQGDGETAFFEL